MQEVLISRSLPQLWCEQTREKFWMVSFKERWPFQPPFKVCSVGGVRPLRGVPRRLLGRKFLYLLPRET